jgi:phosphoenolpyruvate synthase/pyruvate phosphate dikinase
LQEAFENGACDPAALESIGAEIERVFAKTTEMVRLRSSSNAEDGAFFNGAGLYDSYSGCLADDLDDDELGPSRCDASKSDERGVCRALKRVWASLWNVKAFEERAFYGIDQHQVTMGVLVNARSEAELANLVAFTGNPVQKGDKRYLVNAQIDEIPVVSPDPGIWPEQSLLTLDEGKVSEITRAGGSSEVAEGEHVLSDAELKELGGYLAELAALYPLDQEAPEGRSFILDTEWKVMPDGALRIKQVRPFLK